MSFLFIFCFDNPSSRLLYKHDNIRLDNFVKKRAFHLNQNQMFDWNSKTKEKERNRCLGIQ